MEAAPTWRDSRVLLELALELADLLGEVLELGAVTLEEDGDVLRRDLCWVGLWWHGRCWLCAVDVASLALAVISNSDRGT